MKRVIILLLAITVLAIGNPTHYMDGRWYTCGQYEYDTRGNMIHTKTSNGYEEWYENDSRGNKIHTKWSNGYEWWYRWFGKKGRGQVLRCSVDRDGNPI